MQALAQTPENTLQSYAAIHYDTYVFDEDGLLNEAQQLAMIGHVIFSIFTYENCS